MEHPFLMFLDHTQRRSTVGRTPLDEASARRRDLYLTTHDTHNRQISMPPVGFEPKISAGERPAATTTTTTIDTSGQLHTPAALLLKKKSPYSLNRIWGRSLSRYNVLEKIRIPAVYGAILRSSGS